MNSLKTLNFFLNGTHQTKDEPKEAKKQNEIKIMKNELQFKNELIT